MDKTLLRPFDLEAAKSGAELLLHGTDTICTYVAGPDPFGRIVVKINDNGAFIFRDKEGDLKMAPLCWVRRSLSDAAMLPVYRGDVVYSTGGGNRAWRVTRADPTGTVELETNGNGKAWLINPDNLVLEKPVRMVKREAWINLYPPKSSTHCVYTSHGYPSEKMADDVKVKDANRIACVHIEWEEPD